MTIEKFKVRYISDNPSIHFRKGEIYEAYLPLDVPSGKLYAIYIEDDDDPGDYAFPARLFERVIDEDE